MSPAGMFDIDVKPQFCIKLLNHIYWGDKDLIQRSAGTGGNIAKEGRLTDEEFNKD